MPHQPPCSLRPSVPIHPLQVRVAALEKQLREADKQLKDAERKLRSAEEREERHRRASVVVFSRDSWFLAYTFVRSE